MAHNLRDDIVGTLGGHSCDEGLDNSVILPDLLRCLQRYQHASLGTLRD